LAALEARLASSGLLKTSKPAKKTIDAATDDLLIQRLMAAKAAAEARSRELEEKLSALKVQLHDQSERLRTYGHLDDHLAATGRLLRP
jgi:ABC-type phosphate transport system auxiliary subunit